MQAVEPKGRTEIIDPLTGELVPAADFDRLADLDRRLSDAEWEIRIAKRRIERAFAVGDSDCTRASRQAASTAQKLALRRLRERLSIDEWEWQRLLGTYKARSAHQLRHEEAGRLLAHLRDRLAAG